MGMWQACGEPGEATFEISVGGDGCRSWSLAVVGHARSICGSGGGGLIGRSRATHMLRETTAYAQAAMRGRAKDWFAEDVRAAAYSLGRLLGGSS